jgi:hypothetical protein
MKKKGVEMSLNVIIVAAIGLLILVILAFLVVNYVGKFQRGAESCVANGGVCQIASTCSASTSGYLGTRATYTDCTATLPNCCKVVKTT